MDPVANPYRPGAGRRPPLLAGRDSVLDAFDLVRRRAEEIGEGDRSWILTGLRGVGKTVLLNELLSRVSAGGWITAKVEAGSSRSLAAALAQSLVSGLRTTSGRYPEPRLRRLLGVFKAFSVTVDPSGAVGFGIDVAPVRGIADSGRFAEDLAGLFRTLGETARELGVGVLILIDELQEADAGELAALNTAVHEIGQTGVPVPLTVVGAGLPSLPVDLAAATSYAERLYEYRSVGLLDAAAAKAALEVPAGERGVRWGAAALSAALDTAGGYPYFVQAVGKHVWDHARRSPITVEDVAVGIRHARREVDEGLYQVRWERATPAQRDLLRSLAACAGDGTAAAADVARAMGRSRVSDISVARTEVIRKGLVYAPERGLLAFTVPGMHEFVMRQI
jgi:AAA ATPase domain